MSKSILVIDMPKSCSECELFTCNHLIEIQMSLFKLGLYESQKEIKVLSHNKAFDTCPLQDTTELLEYLETIKRLSRFRFKLSKKFYKNTFYETYNKLYKALGGIQ